MRDGSAELDVLLERRKKLWYFAGGAGVAVVDVDERRGTWTDAERVRM